MLFRRFDEVNRRMTAIKEWTIEVDGDEDLILMFLDHLKQAIPEVKWSYEVDGIVGTEEAEIEIDESVGFYCIDFSIDAGDIFREEARFDGLLDEDANLTIGDIKEKIWR